MIEVLYGVKNGEENAEQGLQLFSKKRKSVFWWSESESSEDDDDDDDDDSNSNGNSNDKQKRQNKGGGKDSGDGGADDSNNEDKSKGNKETSKNNKGNKNGNSGTNKTDQKDAGTATSSGPAIRLCDIIDRAPDGDGKWRYYVHYRDFNRRMDEWIGMERVVSPPSVGNSKARALKRQEEKMKRKQAKLEEKAAAAQLVAAASSSSLTSGHQGPSSRSNRRRSSAAVTAATTTATGSGGVSGGGGGGNDATETEAAETPRMTRRQRRKSTVVGDDSTVVASNQRDKRQSVTNQPPSSVMVSGPDKETIKIATTAAAETKVGQHVIATVPAQELDEHEGMDEASLREHEEVTKVKNCSFLELGEFQMETWYFSPLPKELLSDRGFVEVLHVCEFSFRMFSRKSELQRYQARELPKDQRHPPGNEIYRCGNLSSKFPGEWFGCVL